MAFISRLKFRKNKFLIDGDILRRTCVRVYKNVGQEINLNTNGQLK